jgi:hypothetical protein
MARQIRTGKKHETGRTITTKTAYGISSDMVVTDETILSKVNVPEYCVLVYDDMGYFIVNRERVDDGLACPFRYDTMFREKSNEKIMEAING